MKFALIVCVRSNGARGIAIEPGIVRVAVRLDWPADHRRDIAQYLRKRIIDLNL